MLCEHEEFVKKLENEKFHLKHKKEFDAYECHAVPRFFGHILVAFLSLLYGEKPSYQKFKAIELIARIPYQSWEMVSYWMMNFFFVSERASIRWSKAADFGKLGQDNETMHVVVINDICRQEQAGNWFWHTLIPIIVCHVYFFFSYALFVINKRFSYELNYLFEDHAYEQYDAFLKNKSLKKRSVESVYLTYYGRECKNQYDFFLSVRNDELIHRNNSVIEIREL